MNRCGTAKLTVSVIAALLAAATIIPTGNVVGQDKTITTYRGSTVTIRPYTEIPEATEECTPEEKQWWDNLRQAGNDFHKKLDQKSYTKFAVLFAEGVGMGYRVPLKDRPPQVLSVAQPDFPRSLLARMRTYHRQISVELQVEHRADGSIGEIKLIKGVDDEMNDYVVQAARRTIFVPAVKDRAFVTEWQKGGVKYSNQR